MYGAIGCEPPMGSGGYDLSLLAETGSMDIGECLYPVNSGDYELGVCRELA
jgi:hypothetical protein